MSRAMLDLAAVIAAKVPSSQIVEGVTLAVTDSTTGLVAVRTPHGIIRVPGPATGLSTSGDRVRVARIGATWTFLGIVHAGTGQPTFHPTLTNPGFDEPDLTGWTQYGDTPPFTRTTSSPMSGGGGALAGEVDANAYGAAFETFLANAPLQVLPGGYTASIRGRYRDSALRDGTASLEVWTAPSLAGVEPGGPGLVREVVATKTGDLWPDWTLQGTFTVPPARRVLRLVLRFSVAAATANQLVFDDLTLTWVS